MMIDNKEDNSNTPLYIPISTDFCLIYINSFNYDNPSGVRYYYYPHFMDEETEA